MPKLTSDELTKVQAINGLANSEATARKDAALTDNLELLLDVMQHL